MIAKLIAWAPTRDEARHALAAQRWAQRGSTAWKPTATICGRSSHDAPFASGQPWTRCLEGLRYHANTLEVLSGGTQTTVQDYPGRLGYWAVGVPPSGPMDDRALRLGNRLLGNDAGAAATRNHDERSDAALQHGRGRRDHRRGVARLDRTAPFSR